MTMAVIVPALGYTLLRRCVSRYDAAAVAASYGSVSAVTFVTAVQFLESQRMAFGGHMTVAMVLMESPAIIMAVLLANSLRHAQSASSTTGVTAGGAACVAWGPSSTGVSVGQGPARVLHRRRAPAAAGRDGGGLSSAARRERP